MAKVKVSEVKSPHESIKVAVLEAGGEVKWWAKQSVFTDLIKAGGEFDIEVEKKDGKFGEERWVKSCNGQTAQQRAFGGGGGGGFKGAPKDDEAIIAQVILKEACETARTNAHTRGEVLAMTEVGIIAGGLTRIYQSVYRELKDGAK
jgi:hypothetical protein